MTYSILKTLTRGGGWLSNKISNRKRPYAWGFFDLFFDKTSGELGLYLDATGLSMRWRTSMLVAVAASTATAVNPGLKTSVYYKYSGG